MNPSHFKCGPFRAIRPGFALTATILMMVLLVILATGLLSLGAISLRGSTTVKARETARANARLALALAIGELQKSAGDDRRITADAPILDPGGSSSRPGLVGVWESWSPDFASNPTRGTPDYEGEKDRGFLRWLVSHPDPDAPGDMDFGSRSVDPADPNVVEVFDAETDGFSLSADRVPVPDGGYAWAVTQEGTKAKINVAGPETGPGRDLNDQLHVQSRPNLTLSETFSQPSDDWHPRAGKVLSLAQAGLDDDLSGDSRTTAARAHYTALSMGLLTNVVAGGLKTDLNLGFELSDADFAASGWGDHQNPFQAGNASLPAEVRANYRGQRPLFTPLSPTGTYSADLSFDPANVQFNFPVTAIPTFETLRDFYRIPKHLYLTSDGPTVFERAADHVAISDPPATRNRHPTPAAVPPGEESRTGIRPVVDRIMFLLSVGLSQRNEARLIITPVVTLWNPYNVALEIEGAVTYPWIDVPFNVDWTFYNDAGGAEGNRNVAMSLVMGYQFRNQNHGRSVDPYFFAAITPTGEPLPATGATDPIRFEPGEVRVFAPADTTPVEFNAAASVRNRTTFLRPVESVNQLTTRGGLSVPTLNPHQGNHGFVRTMKQGERVAVNFKPSTGDDYPFFIALEDATRARGSRISNATRGQAIVDVLVRNFARSGDTAELRSPVLTYDQIKAEPVPIGVLEAYHRLADGDRTTQAADLVYTGNPRQAWMNNYVIEGSSFVTGPQYQIRMRPVGSFSGLLETQDGGRTAFYGASNSVVDGRSHLSFFEAPRAPLLSLAAFQHADLAANPFSPAAQFGNSWASAYVPRQLVATGPLNVDHVYLLNEALWDGFFFSGAAPTIVPGTATGSASVWENPVATTTRPVSSVLSDFVRDPASSPLRNPRMRLEKGGLPEQEIISELLQPQGCVKIAAHLMLDGAFNVNSTSVEAWTAVLAGLRDAAFEVNGTPPPSGTTPFPRFRNPVGEPNDNWHGFRTLNDGQLRQLAENIVAEVRSRGPFLSLAEFVNRRVDSSEFGLTGALQAAIDAAGFNQDALYDPIALNSYPRRSRDNLAPPYTGVGIPGYLTQADVLQSLAPVITVRSDTFTIRAYGEARDPAGEIISTAWCEAVVQRQPDFLDPSDPPYTPASDLNPTNATFGRRFEIISFRYLAPGEIPS